MMFFRSVIDLFSTIFQQDSEAGSTAMHSDHQRFTLADMSETPFSDSLSGGSIDRSFDDFSDMSSGSYSGLESLEPHDYTGGGVVFSDWSDF